MVFRNAEEGKKLVSSTTTFAFDLFKQLSAAKEGDNVFLSPASISMALAMTYLGAKGNTAEEMGRVLKFSDVHPDHLHSSMADLRTALVSGESFTLHLANKLYPQEGYNFLDSFLEGARKHYDVDIENVDYQGDTEGARQLINQWVESQTNDKIKDLLPSGSVNDLTRMVLVNAIYFKGDWHRKFEAENTYDADFRLADGGVVKVPLMFMKAKFNYGMSSTLNTKALELPYKDGKLSMIVLLPEHPDGITALEQNLTPDHIINLEQQFSIMRNVEVNVNLPRFKLEDSFDLGGTLADMGIRDLFNQNAADLSGLDGSRELFVSKVVHKAFVEVNEEGSEAAAATGVVIMLKSLPRSFNFKADHPFLFFIRENITGAVLFLGKYSRPAGAPEATGKTEL